jgi:hypothetical protein
MKTELDVIADISYRLDRLGISYMLTGSIAMNYYAEPRMTRDIDIVVEIGEADEARLVKELSPDYYIDAAAVRGALHNKTMFNILHLESVIKVDCIIRQDSEYRQTEFKRRRKIAIGDFSTFIVGKEDLILSKLYWARDSHSEMQMKDVRNLLRTGYDAAYVERWAAVLGVADLYKECLHA